MLPAVFFFVFFLNANGSFTSSSVIIFSFISDELIKAIEGDLSKASTLLEKPSALAFKDDNFFNADEES